MQVLGPTLNQPAQCEAILRSLPMWFGIEESLLCYARDSAKLPTFALAEHDTLVGFLSLTKHFSQAWEVHCVAIRNDCRNRGYGRTLLTHAEHWLAEQHVQFLQVKTIAANSPDPYYAQTRSFYSRMGYAPLEVFPDLWAPTNPCLQMIKVLNRPQA